MVDLELYWSQVHMQENSPPMSLSSLKPELFATNPVFELWSPSGSELIRLSDLRFSIFELALLKTGTVLDIAV